MLLVQTSNVFLIVIIHSCGHVPYEGNTTLSESILLRVGNRPIPNRILAQWITVRWEANCVEFEMYIQKPHKINQENIFLSTEHLKPLNVWIHDVCSFYVLFLPEKTLTHFSALIYTLVFSVLPQHKNGEQTNNTGISVNVVNMFLPAPSNDERMMVVCSTPYVELLISTLTSQYIIFRLYR